MSTGHVRTLQESVIPLPSPKRYRRQTTNVPPHMTDSQRCRREASTNASRTQQRIVMLPRCLCTAARFRQPKTTHVSWACGNCNSQQSSPPHHTRTTGAYGLYIKMPSPAHASQNTTAQTYHTRHKRPTHRTSCAVVMQVHNKHNTQQCGRGDEFLNRTSP